MKTRYKGVIRPSPCGILGLQRPGRGDEVPPMSQPTELVHHVPRAGDDAPIEAAPPAQGPYPWLIIGLPVLTFVAAFCWALLHG